MSNILNHNRHIFEFDLNKEDYWDFHLCLDQQYGGDYDGLTERCLSVYIDLSDDECIWFDHIYSNAKYVWDDATNNGLIFNNFGYTSIDNGRTYYEKDRISNKDFFNIYTNTTFELEENEKRLEMVKIRGNHKIYDYSVDITYWKDKFQVGKFNGGWYQGFFCANNGTDYKILPTSLGNGWNFEFVLNKEDFTNDKLTLNDIYPENKGIFFYIGTRAENKWWTKYLTDHNFDHCKKSAFDDEYVENDYLDTTFLNGKYLIDEENDKDFLLPFGDEYMKMKKCYKCDGCNAYINEEYFMEDMKIDDDMFLTTDDGYDFYQPNVGEIKTDNKFLIFDRTKDGQKANKWDEDTEFYLTYIKKPNIGNYFTLFHRGKGGYTARTIEKVLEEKSKEYNVLQDIYRNAFALQIKDNGTIGYKYLVKDCESEEENYKIESEFTHFPIIHDKLWYTINVKIVPVINWNKLYNPKCINPTNASEKMKIYVYVNGKLVLVSRELPMLNLKLLNDLPQKQEGVPFNMSLGGGTQGLAEVVYLNFLKLPEYVLPLEKEFGGSFIGYIKTFRFYTCPLNYAEIYGNHVFSEKQTIYY